MFVEDKAIGEPQTKSVDEVGQVLLAAADLIERCGLHQRFYFGRMGEYCAWGAIGTVVGLDRGALQLAYHMHNDYRINPHSTIHKAVARLETHLHGVPLAEWNDHLGRTKEEVVTVMRSAAHVV
jgi:hypothetical protein